MKVVGVAVARTGADLNEPIPLTVCNDLSSFGFFQRQSVKEMLLFLTKTFLKRTEPGQRQSVEHEGYVVHCYVRSDGLAGTVTTDMEYPARVAFVMLGQLLDEYTQQHGDAWKSATEPESIPFPKAETYVQKYQNPAEADKVTKIQKDLDETTQILHKTIDSVLERGVKLDNLVEKSNDLSAQSKMFYKQAKKTNSCCVIS
uniref:V-SNARE coiled-coil homology domain-containing protein n=2 Tax=Amphora coffeiformis TaxID=265554 RepID=A0A7S3PDT7_9STRA|mmetsp:Transcript_6003/g.12050  ORF Transcript_6003/g.12050 Transcript_6003/m.12050 type:complete len:201 (-) Transcript_6003:124-726(-)|eukprot:scaffold13094_cov162-Amphora_coffeaeformis.AAC.3